MPKGTLIETLCTMYLCSILRPNAAASHGRNARVD